MRVSSGRRATRWSRLPAPCRRLRVGQHDEIGEVLSPLTRWLQERENRCGKRTLPDGAPRGPHGFQPGGERQGGKFSAGQNWIRYQPRQKSAFSKQCTAPECGAGAAPARSPVLEQPTMARRKFAAQATAALRISESASTGLRRDASPGLVFRISEIAAIAPSSALTARRNLARLMFCSADTSAESWTLPN